MSDNFTPRLGRIGWKAGTRLDRYINRVMNAAHAAGHANGTSRSKFTGEGQPLARWQGQGSMPAVNAALS